MCYIFLSAVQYNSEWVLTDSIYLLHCWKHSFYLYITCISAIIFNMINNLITLLEVNVIFYKLEFI